MEHLGWDDGWSAAFAELPDAAGLVRARIAAVHRGRVRVLGDDDLDESGCAVRGAVPEDRLESWRKLQREGMDAAERRARGRDGSKAYREWQRLQRR